MAVNRQLAVALATLPRARRRGTNRHFTRGILGILTVVLTAAGSTNCSCNEPPPGVPGGSSCDTTCPNYSLSDSEQYELQPYCSSSETGSNWQAPCAHAVTVCKPEGPVRGYSCNAVEPYFAYAVCSRHESSAPAHPESLVIREQCSGDGPDQSNADTAEVCGSDTSAGAIREVPAGACLDPAARAPLSGPLPETMTIGLNVVVTKRNGSPIVDRARVDSEVDLANQAFDSGDVRFSINSFTTSDSISPDVTESIKNNEIFQLTSKIAVLYVENLSSGGGQAWSNGSGLVVATNGAHAILAHELAHVLGLGHTYDADDFVSDTVYDPWACEFSSACFTGACADCTYESCPPPYENTHPDPRNVVGPAVHPKTRVSQQCNTRLTSGQWDLIHCTLRTSQKRLVPCLQCGDGYSCENDTCVCHKTTCNGACVSLGTDENCSACNDSCLAGSKCLGKNQGCSATPPCPGAIDCGFDCFGNQVCVPKNKPGGCPHFACP